jgi:outer membrane protein
MVTIQKALREALETVGSEGGYICVFDLSSGIPYISKTLCEDLTAKIKAKLGIPANALPAAAPAGK